MKRAFTLIELLIVVAIIAILAAIAVPNFLEAQMRAKVARCKSDMRALTTAIETYKIDNNKYSTDCGNGAAGIWRPYAGGARQVDPPANLTIGYELSTPISYISSADVFIDPFKSGKLGYYRIQNPTLRGREYYFFMNIPLRMEKDPAGMPTWKAAELVAGAYCLWAAGPDGWTNNNTVTGRDFSNAIQIPRSISYDATNGTVSNGDVYRTQKSSDGIILRTDVPANG